MSNFGPGRPSGGGGYVALTGAGETSTSGSLIMTGPMEFRKPIMAYERVQMQDSLVVENFASFQSSVGVKSLIASNAIEVGGGTLRAGTSGVGFYNAGSITQQSINSGLSATAASIATALLTTGLFKKK